MNKIKKIDVKTETEIILKKYKVQISKSLGQNFLINESAIDTIISAGNIGKTDLIIEIGPGLGVLTSRMLEQAYKLIAVELDEKMVSIIKDRFKYYNNLEIINQDILKVNLNKIIEEGRVGAEKNGVEINAVKVVANLPYYISTPIVMQLLESRYDIDEIIVMVQKEVADRLISKPGSKLSGAITYAINYYSEAEKIIDVGKDSFIPQPKVESEVIKLKLRKEPKNKVENEKRLFELIKMTFSQRRKTLINTLINYKFVNSKEEAIQIIRDMNLKDDARGETLTLEQFIELSKKLK